MRIEIEDRQCRLAVYVWVGEEHTPCGPAWLLAAEDATVGQHELAQQLGAMLTRLVRYVDGAAANGARGGVEGRVGVGGGEHVPVGGSDLA
eukprot:scaffold100000_cov27-Tisochrysis_lutea.AAC.3